MSRATAGGMLAFMTIVIAVGVAFVVFAMSRFGQSTATASQFSPCFNSDVARLNDDFNAGRYGTINAELVRTFRKVSENELKIWLVDTRQKLGPILDTKFHDKHRFSWGNQNFLACYFDVRFAAGPASELVVWNDRGPRPVLRFFGIRSLGNTPKIRNAPLPN